jgi:hypothetical protein
MRWWSCEPMVRGKVEKRDWLFQLDFSLTFFQARFLLTSLGLGLICTTVAIDCMVMTTS